VGSTEVLVELLEALATSAISVSGAEVGTADASAETAGASTESDVVLVLFVY